MGSLGLLEMMRRVLVSKAPGLKSLQRTYVEMLVDPDSCGSFEGLVVSRSSDGGFVPFYAPAAACGGSGVAPAEEAPVTASITPTTTAVAAAAAHADSFEAKSEALGPHEGLAASRQRELRLEKYVVVGECHDGVLLLPVGRDQPAVRTGDSVRITMNGSSVEATARYFTREQLLNHANYLNALPALRVIVRYLNALLAAGALPLQQNSCAEAVMKALRSCPAPAAAVLASAVLGDNPPGVVSSKESIAIASAVFAAAGGGAGSAASGNTAVPSSAAACSPAAAEDARTWPGLWTSDEDNISWCLSEGDVRSKSEVSQREIGFTCFRVPLAELDSVQRHIAPAGVLETLVNLDLASWGQEGKKSICIASQLKECLALVFALCLPCARDGPGTGGMVACCCGIAEMGPMAPPHNFRIETRPLVLPLPELCQTCWLLAIDDWCRRTKAMIQKHPTGDAYGQWGIGDVKWPEAAGEVPVVDMVGYYGSGAAFWRGPMKELLHWLGKRLEPQDAAGGGACATAGGGSDSDTARRSELSVVMLMVQARRVVAMIFHVAQAMNKSSSQNNARALYELLISEDAVSVGSKAIDPRDSCGPEGLSRALNFVTARDKPYVYQKLAVLLGRSPDKYEYRRICAEAVDHKHVTGAPLFDLKYRLESAGSQRGTKRRAEELDSDESPSRDGYRNPRPHTGFTPLRSGFMPTSKTDEVSIRVNDDGSLYRDDQQGRRRAPAASHESSLASRTSMAAAAAPGDALVVDFPATKVKAGQRKKYPAGPAGSGLREVEDVALDWYRAEGWTGIHSEWRVPQMLVRLMLSDVMFDKSLPITTYTGLQAQWLDHQCPYIAERRQEPLADRLAEIASMTPEELAVDAVVRRDRMCSIGHRSVHDKVYTRTEIAELMMAFGGPKLSLLLRALCTEPFTSLCGVPDLLLWRLPPSAKRHVEAILSDNDLEEWKQNVRERLNESDAAGAARSERASGPSNDLACALEPLFGEPAAKTEASPPLKAAVLFVEVKSVKDNLSNDQKAWMVRLTDAGLVTEVCRVRKSGEK